MKHIPFPRQKTVERRAEPFYPINYRGWSMNMHEYEYAYLTAPNPQGPF